MTNLLGGHLLTVLIFFPTAAAVVLLLFPKNAGRAAMVVRHGRLRRRARPLHPALDRLPSAAPGFQFAERVEWIPALGISYPIGIDGISLLLILLTTVLTPISLLFSVTHVSRSARGFAFAFLVLETGVIGTLCALDLALFYGVPGSHARADVLHHRDLGRRAAHLRRDGLPLHDGGKPAHVPGDPLRRCAASRADGLRSFLLSQLTRIDFPATVQAILFFAFALAFAIKVPGPFPSTRGCPTRTPRRPPPHRFFSPAFC